MEQNQEKPRKPELSVKAEKEVAMNLSSQPQQVKSVDPRRKDQLLLEARADRLAWIQSIPLPYNHENGENNSMENLGRMDGVDKHPSGKYFFSSHAAQQLPSISNVLGVLYGTNDPGEHIQSILEPPSGERTQAVPSGDEVLSEALEQAQQDQTPSGEKTKSSVRSDREILEAYRGFLTQMQTPASAALANGIRNYVRNIRLRSQQQQTQQKNQPASPDEADAAAVGNMESLASSLRTYLDSTLETMKNQQPLWQDDSVRQSLESFLYGHAHPIVWSTLFSSEKITKDDDECWNRCQSLAFIEPNHLDIACLVKEDVESLLSPAIQSLLSIDSYYSPFEKLQRILNTYHRVNWALSEALNRATSPSDEDKHSESEPKKQSQRLPSADDVLPTFILTVLKGKPKRLVANLRMIEIFAPQEHLRGEAGYAYTNLYGAVQFLLDINLDDDSPGSLTIDAEEFRKGLQESRASTERRLSTRKAMTPEKEQDKNVDSDPFLLMHPTEIPVREVRAARLRGEDVNLEWATRWVEQNGKEFSSPTGEDSTEDHFELSLPSGFVRSYSFLSTGPDEIRVTDLPKLLTEYRMLVKTVEQLLGERSSRLAAERKKRLVDAQRAIEQNAAELDFEEIIGGVKKEEKKKDLTTTIIEEALASVADETKEEDKAESAQKTEEEEGKDKEEEE